MVINAHWGRDEIAAISQTIFFECRILHENVYGNVMIETIIPFLIPAT